MADPSCDPTIGCFAASNLLTARPGKRPRRVSGTHPRSVPSGEGYKEGAASGPSSDKAKAFPPQTSLPGESQADGLAVPRVQTLAVPRAPSIKNLEHKNQVIAIDSQLWRSNRADWSHQPEGLRLAIDGQHRRLLSPVASHRCSC